MTAPIFVELPLAGPRVRDDQTIIINAALVTAISDGDRPEFCVVTVAQLGGGIVHAAIEGPKRAVALALSMGLPDRPTAWTAEQLEAVDQ